MGDLNEKVMINYLIDKYADLQRIKKVQKSENEELDYQIKIAQVELAIYGINTQGLEY